MQQEAPGGGGWAEWYLGIYQAQMAHGSLDHVTLSWEEPGARRLLPGLSPVIDVR